MLFVNQDKKAFLNKIPLLEADGHKRYSGIILEGRPGIGKTSFAMSVVPNVPRSRVVRIPMATRTYEEFGSYPFPVKESVTGYAFDEDGNVLKENGVAVKEEREVVRVHQALSEVSIEPLLEENIGDDYGILILDDVTLGDPRLQNALLEIVQFGVIAGRQLGKNVIIFLTGNKTDDGAYAIEWSTPLVGRCVKISLEPNFQTWLTVDENQDVDPTVVGFLQEHPAYFAPVSGDPKTTDPDGRTPSPRDWTRLGLAMNKVGGYANFEPDFIFTSQMVYASSMVGSLGGQAYDQYARTFATYPSALSLLEDLSLWDDVPEEQKDMLSGTIGVIFGLRNVTVKNLERIQEMKGKAQGEEAFEALNKMMDVIYKISEQNREVISFGLSSINAWVEQGDAKERGFANVALAKVITQEKFIKCEEFKAFLSATWEYKQKSK